MLDRETYTELFIMQTIGAMATAFVYGRVEPGEFWPMLRGEKELTLRAIAEIGHATGYNMHMQLSDARRLERQEPADDD